MTPDRKWEFWPDDERSRVTWMQLISRLIAPLPAVVALPHAPVSAARPPPLTRLETVHVQPEVRISGHVSYFFLLSSYVIIHNLTQQIYYKTTVFLIFKKIK
jgi:hypothetical protein